MILHEYDKRFQQNMSMLSHRFVHQHSIYRNILYMSTVYRNQLRTGGAVMERSPFLNHIRQELRLRGYSLRTEKTYLQWIKRYIEFQRLTHPAQMGTPEVAICCLCRPVSAKNSDRFTALLALS